MGTTSTRAHPVFTATGHWWTETRTSAPWRTGDSLRSSHQSGNSSYFDGAALNECAKFTTDDVAQFLHFRDMGYFQSVPAVYAELADLVAGHLPGRQSAEERTMAVNLGLALEDIAVAPLVYAKAQEAGAGRWLPL